MMCKCIVRQTEYSCLLCVMICLTPAAQRHSCSLLAKPIERAAAGPMDRRELGKERQG